MNRLSAREYIRWRHYYDIEPFGSIREDYRFGQICATAANLMEAGGKGVTLEATDFIPTFDSELKRIENETVAAMNSEIKSKFGALKALATQPKRLNK